MEVKYLKWIKNRLSLMVIIIIIFLLGFEAYAIAVVHIENQVSLPRNYGNFERIRNSLAEQEPRKEFSFAVIGNTNTIGGRTFKNLCDKLQNEQLSFMVILGDFVKRCAKSNHDYFRSECANKYRLPWPVFLVVGDQDVAFDEMNYDTDKVSLTDFEKMYGPSNFSFEYNGCLFIGLCMLPPPYSIKKSIDYLESTLSTRQVGNKKLFVFLHTLPVMTTGSKTNRFENVQAFMDIVNRYKVDYIISAHNDTCTKTKQGNTIYLTMAGGAPLAKKEVSNGLNRAVVLTVGPKLVSEKNIFAKDNIDILGAFRHFAIANLHPLYKKHPASIIVENFLILSMFFVFLHNAVKSGKNTR
jgi:hypothetical protein